MKIARWGGAAILGAALGLAMAAPGYAQDDPAFAHGQPAFTAAAGEHCGEVAITFTNPTPWLMVFDVRVDDAAAEHESVAPGATITEGPLAGQEFGPRWTLVEVDGRAGTHESTETFPFAESVEVRLAEGAEQKLFFDFQAVDTTAVTECPEPTKPPADPGEPTTEPTDDPAPGKGGSADEELPVTGLSMPMLLGGAGVLGAAGGATLWLTRRRRVSFTAG